MIYLRLFLNFLMIGALSFGGGYGMVSLVRETVLSNGWLTENEFLNFIAVSESTPGPLAVNMATFIGSTLGGILGSFVATLGVVLPSFLIILLIASALKNLMKYAPVNAFLSGVRPCVVAMILATALSMALSTLLGLTDLQTGFAPDLRSIAVFAMLGATHLICKKIRKTAPSPILMILFSAGLGILFWCMPSLSLFQTASNKAFRFHFFVLSSNHLMTVVSKISLISALGIIRATMPSGNSPL